MHGKALQVIIRFQLTNIQLATPLNHNIYKRVFYNDFNENIQNRYDFGC